MACCQCTGVRSPGSSSPDCLPATGHGGPPPPALAPPLPRTEQAPTLGPASSPPQAAAPPLARHPCQQQAAPAGHTRAALSRRPPWSQITHAPQSGIRYVLLHSSLTLLNFPPLHSMHHHSAEHMHYFQDACTTIKHQVCNAQLSHTAQVAASAQHALTTVQNACTTIRHQVCVVAQHSYTAQGATSAQHAPITLRVACTTIKHQVCNAQLSHTAQVAASAQHALITVQNACTTIRHQVCDAQHSHTAQLAAPVKRAPFVFRTHASQSSIRYVLHSTLRLFVCCKLHAVGIAGHAVQVTIVGEGTVGCNQGISWQGLSAQPCPWVEAPLIINLIASSRRLCMRSAHFAFRGLVPTTDSLYTHDYQPHVVT